MKLLDFDHRYLAGGPKVTVPRRDSFHTAPGFRELGWLCQVIPDATYPWDPDVVRRIQEFVPDVVPLWVQWVFLSPSDTGNPEVVVFGRHALGRSLRNQRGWLPEFKVSMPSTWPGLKFGRPNLFWFLHDGVNTSKYRDLPGNYLPFDGSIVDRAWQSWAGGQNLTDRQYKDLLRADLLAPAQKRGQEAEKKAADRQKAWDDDVGPYVQGQLDSVSDVEREEYLGSKVGTTPT